MPNNGSLLVGVTGGIGAGKSTVCRIFESLGRAVFSADSIAHELTDKDPSVKDQIRRKFGEAAFLPNGFLDRRRMAELVFSDPRARKSLNAIVHPAVFKALDSWLEALPGDRRKAYVIVEAALIFETDLQKRLDFIITVTAPEATCIARVVGRDGSTPEEVRRRMEAQMPANMKPSLSDFVIGNDGDMPSLNSRVALLDRILTGITSSR